MDKDESAKGLKFGDGEVRGLNGAQTLISIDSNAYMGLINHGDIVSSISDREGKRLRIILLDHADHLSLLLWGDSAADNCFTCLTHSNEVGL